MTKLKRILLSLSILCTIHFTLLACTCSPRDILSYLCQILRETDGYVLKGEVLFVDEDEMEWTIHVLDQLRGEEMVDTILYRSVSSCMEPLRNTFVGDTVIFASTIFDFEDTTYHNSYPHFFQFSCHYLELDYRNNMVSGLIQPNVNQMSYDDFKAYVQGGYFNQECVKTNTRDLEQIVKIDLYPNPARHGLMIDASEEIEILFLYDSRGQLVRKIEGIRQKRLWLDLEDQAPGLYFVEVNGRKAYGLDRILKQ